MSALAATQAATQAPLAGHRLHPYCLPLVPLLPLPLLPLPLLLLSHR
jgi:hypothetical protein